MMLIRRRRAAGLKKLSLKLFSDRKGAKSGSTGKLAQFTGRQRSVAINLRHYQKLKEFIAQGRALLSEWERRRERLEQ